MTRLCCDCDPTILMYTPTGIQASFEDDNGDPLDPFADAVSFDDSAITSQAVAALWARYRYAMISSCNPGRWLQAVRDRATMVKPRYAAIFAGYQSALADLSSIDTGYTTEVSTSGTETTQVTPTEGSGRATVTPTARTGTTTVTPTDSTATTESEAIPATADASSSRWLTDRQTVTTTPSGSTTEVSETPSGSTTEYSDTPSGSTTVRTPDTVVRTVHTDSMQSAAARVRELMTDMPDPFERYAEEFSDLFANRWSMI